MERKRRLIAAVGCATLALGIVVGVAILPYVAVLSAMAPDDIRLPNGYVLWESDLVLERPSQPGRDGAKLPRHVVRLQVVGDLVVGLGVRPGRPGPREGAAEYFILDTGTDAVNYDMTREHFIEKLRERYGHDAPELLSPKEYLERNPEARWP